MKTLEISDTYLHTHRTPEECKRNSPAHQLQRSMKMPLTLPDQGKFPCVQQHQLPQTPLQHATTTPTAAVAEWSWEHQEMPDAGLSQDLTIK